MLCNYRDSIVFIGTQTWLLSNVTRHTCPIWNTSQHQTRDWPPTQSGRCNQKTIFYVLILKTLLKFPTIHFLWLLSQQGNQKLGFIQPSGNITNGIFHDFQAETCSLSFVWEPLKPFMQMLKECFLKVVSRSPRHKHGVTGLLVQVTK